MKSIAFFSDFARLVFICLLIVVPITNGFSQSGQGKQNPPTSQAVPINEPKENKEEVPKLEIYDYIETMPIRDFIDKLNYFGAKGYRLKDVTQIPDVGEEIFSPTITTKLAGIVKLDEEKFEYKTLNVEETADLSVDLNRESKEGFNFSEIITYENTNPEYHFDISDIFTRDSIARSMNVIISRPVIYNLILLERKMEKTAAPRQFQVLKAGYGFNMNPTKKMQTLMDEAAKQNMFPIASFTSRVTSFVPPDKGKRKIMDNYYGAILEKSNEKLDAQIQFVRATSQKDFEKRINQLASEGLQIANSRLTQAFMYKDPKTPQTPTTYKWVHSNPKSLEDDLSKSSNENAQFIGTALSQDIWEGLITENLLVFEQPTGETKVRYEYKSLKMIEDFHQGVLTARSNDLPEQAITQFRKMIKEGYSFTKLFYANEKVTALFERPILK